MFSTNKYGFDPAAESSENWVREQVKQSESWDGQTVTAVSSRNTTTKNCEYTQAFS